MTPNFIADHINIWGQGEIFTNVQLPVPYENPVVIKQLFVRDKRNAKRILLAFRQEVAILWYLHDHANIVKMFGYSEKELMIIMRYYPRGSLFNFIYDRNVVEISSAVTLTLFRDVASAIKILHATGIVHNDLKPANILIEDRDGRLRAVLADFGISHVVDNRLTGVRKMVVQNIVGASPLYAAPEVLLRLKKLPTPLSPRIARGGDVYSFATVMFELLNRKLYDMLPPPPEPPRNS
jgi:serine/threonine protein kinase